MIAEAIKPNATEKAIAKTPGIKNAWLNTYLPSLVEPVSSICTAPRSVGYVGKTNRADTAAKDATSIYASPGFAALIPKAATTTGVIAFAVAA